MERSNGFNWNRYYAPQDCRYLQPDPIGQAGGLNVFPYAGQRPTVFIDPEGEFMGPAVGVAAGSTGAATASAGVGTGAAATIGGGAAAAGAGIGAAGAAAAVSVLSSQRSAYPPIALSFLQSAHIRGNGLAQLAATFSRSTRMRAVLTARPERSPVQTRRLHVGKQNGRQPNPRREAATRVTASVFA